MLTMEVHDRAGTVNANERSEDALMVRIHKELELVREINGQERNLQNVIRLQASLTRILALCEFGREHLYSLTLRGVNRIRLTENEMNDVSQQVRKSLRHKSKKELLNIWEIGSNR